MEITSKFIENQGLSQDLETGSPKLAIVKFGGILLTLYSDCNHILVFIH